MLTFHDLQQHVLRYIDEGDDAVAGTTRALVKDALNRSHRALLTERSWPFMLWPGERSFTTVSGTRTYALPHGTGKILSLYDSGYNEPVPMIGRREWEGIGVNRAGTEAVPYGVIYGETWPVAVQPSGNYTLAATTTSVADAGDATIACEVTGLDANGDYQTETLNLQDSAGVVALSSSTWSYILTVTRTGAPVGNFTLLGNGGAANVTLLSLSASQYGKQYPTLEFVETPNVARTYLYTAMRTPRVLAHNNDIPDTPYPFSELHVYDALLDLTGYNTELGAKEQRLWADRRQKLWDGLVTAYEDTIAGSRPRFVRNMNPRSIGRTWTSA